MACRGVFFALDKELTSRVLSANDDAQLMEVIAQIEEAWDQDHLAECDKSWDAMHRLLSDGTLDWNGGEYPLSHVVLGDSSLHQDPSYIVCLKDVACVQEISYAIQGISRSQFEAWYYSKAKNYAPEYGDEDCAYTWDNFEDVRNFYEIASNSGRSVIFTVDQ
jgi:hypothetical protein